MTREELDSLVSDCKDALVEFGFQKRRAEIEGFWTVGKRIQEDIDSIHSEEAMQLIKGTGKTLDQLRNMVLVARRWPRFEDIPIDKHTNWKMVVDLAREG